MLEISFYYVTIMLAIIFLVLQSFFKLKVKTHISELPVNDPLYPEYDKINKNPFDLNDTDPTPNN